MNIQVPFWEVPASCRGQRRVQRWCPLPYILSESISVLSCCLSEASARPSPVLPNCLAKDLVLIRPSCREGANTFQQACPNPVLSHCFSKAGGCVQSTKSLDCLALVARGLCLSGSPETETIGETILGRLPPPGHCTDRLKYTPFLL